MGRRKELDRRRERVRRRREEGGVQTETGRRVTRGSEQGRCVGRGGGESV